MNYNEINNKAICVAVRTFFSDAVGLEHEIWEWLIATESNDSLCPYWTWHVVANLSNNELYDVVDSLRADILYSMQG